MGLSDSFDLDPGLTFQMNDHLLPGPDGRNNLCLRFVFSDAEENTPASAAVPSGTSVGTFLRTFQHFSKRQISSLKFRENGIRVNGKTQRVSFVLRAGDVLEITLKSAGSLYLNHGTFTSPPEILYEDSELLIVNKPSGMVCHPSPGHYADTLANQAAAYASGRNESWSIRITGRLDKDTSGIVIFAKNSETAARLSSSSAAEKEYRALVEGELTLPARICLPIAPDDYILGKMKIDPAGKPAETIFDPVRIFDGKQLFTTGTLPPGCSISGRYTLLKLRLVHGRTHQIRLHLSSIGHPLIGDAMYGNGIKGETHALLHCRTADLIHPFTGTDLRVTAPYPDDWPEAAKL